MEMNSERVYESELYDIWKKNAFNPYILNDEGLKIEILDCGEPNTDQSGPDFRNARVKIGNITYVGDIEIDNSHSDWKAHGHYLNKRYNKVILHTYLLQNNASCFVYTQSGRRIPSLSFNSLVKEQVVVSSQDKTESKSKVNNCSIPCKTLLPQISDAEKLDIFYQFGIEKFKKKCEKMIERLRELLFIDEMKIEEPLIKYDIPKEFQEKKFSKQEINKTELWEQLFYEFLFEALGYSQNRGIMQKIAKNADLKYFRSINNGENRVVKFESALMNIAGLIPKDIASVDDNSSDYLRKVYEYRTELLDLYTGKTFHEEDWHFFKLRPQNFPTIRLAAGARMINHILNDEFIHLLVKKFSEVYNVSVLSQLIQKMLIIKSDGYWSRHYIFNKPAKETIKYFIGSNRADEIMLNVILPFMYVYFDLFDNEKLTNKVLKMFSEAKLNLDNSLVREISECFELGNSWQRCVINQGMLELFRNHCSKELCSECPIGKKVFNFNE